MDILLVANPENRRAQFFTQAVEARGGRARIIPWIDVLRGATVEAEHVRIESPGESWAVESALLGRDEPEDPGRIRGLGEAHAAMVEAMSGFRARRFMNPPAQIAAMFDKLETKRRVGALAPTTHGVVHGFEELRDVMARVPRRRAFVKPRHGSSASGVIALTMTNDRVLAITSAEMEGSRLYNSLKIRRYSTFGDVERLVDLLGAEDELIVEAWVPKASTEDGTFDLRIVVIDGEAQHAVVRVSRQPMTNLHLGNRRGDLTRLQEQLPDAWQRMLAAAREAMATFPGALYAGVDVCVATGHQHVAVFEVNAFGDLLPGIVDAHGRSTYEAELDAFMGSETRP